ncbi:MAG TPA: glycosyltransferase family 2 protein [Conexivisphaerales archaeon]|nr:glycosyltransferase family 2 protein [Conexivisphaerales archaeon]
MQLLPYGVSSLLGQVLLAVSVPPLLVYAARLYLFSLVSLRKRATVEKAAPDGAERMVSVIVPLFNRAALVDELMARLTSFSWPDYEVIVADDSHDSSPERLEKWREDPRVTVVYRPTRRGWKAGALNDALRSVSPRSDFCLFLDADSLPEPDLIGRMVSRMEETGADVVQGAQRPDANASDSWVSRGLSLVLDGYNLVDLQARKELGLLIPLTGSNFMMRTGLIRANTFREDATEDWELTAQLWSKGWKVVYAPDIAVSGRTTDRVRGLLHRYSLWAGSTTADTVSLGGAILRSRNLRRRVKLDFFLSGLSYLMSVFVILAVVGAILVPSPFVGRASTPVLTFSVISALFVLPAPPISLLVAAHASKTRRSLNSVAMALLGSIVVLPVVAFSSLRGLFRRGKPVDVKTDASWVDVDALEAEARD